MENKIETFSPLTWIDLCRLFCVLGANLVVSSQLIYFHDVICHHYWGLLWMKYWDLSGMLLCFSIHLGRNWVNVYSVTTFICTDILSSSCLSSTSLPKPSLPPFLSLFSISDITLFAAHPVQYVWGTRASWAAWEWEEASVSESSKAAHSLSSGNPLEG